MHRTVALRLLGGALASLALLGGLMAGPAPSASAASPRASDLLTGLRTATRTSAAGAGTGFTWWRAADGSCRTPAVQVLTARSTVRVSPGGCRVTTGRWTSAFTGARLTSTRTATVQWTVPLQVAWQSGAAGWSSDRRRAYANDVGAATSLLVVDATSAKRRGSKDPTAWMPVSKQRCSYTKAWIATKSRWGLAVTPAERKALAAALRRYCAASPTVAAPGTPDVAALNGTPAPTTTPAPAPSSTSPTPSSSPTPSASPTVSPTPTPTPTPTPRPAPACSATSAPGADLLPLVPDAAGAVDVGAGLHGFTDFTAAPWGVDLPQTVTALRGAADGSTVLQLRTCTSTHAADVPTASGTTNQLSLLRVSGSPVLQDLTLQATEQGHLYNGLRLNQTVHALVQRVTVRGVPGRSDTPPGETFAVNDFKTNGTVYDHVRVDGQDVGGAGLGFNSSGSAEIRDSAFVGERYSAGVTIWQTSDVTISGTTLTGDKLGLNLERAAGGITCTGCVFGGDGTDLRIASDRTPTASVTITDPVLPANGMLRISLPATYRGVPNTQTRADVTVVVDGQDVTDRVVQWVP